VLCETPLYVGEGKGCPGQRSWSRDIDQNERRLTKHCLRAQGTKALAFASVKISFCVSPWPIVGVSPVCCEGPAPGRAYWFEELKRRSSGRL
jgi:hypothetical protein